MGSTAHKASGITATVMRRPSLERIPAGKSRGHPLRAQVLMSCATFPATCRDFSAEVVEHGLGGVAAVDRDHAAARMGARPAQVAALRTGAVGQPPVPHELRQALALEDVAAGEPDLALDVGRRERLENRSAVTEMWGRRLETQVVQQPAVEELKILRVERWRIRW